MSEVKIELGPAHRLYKLRSDAEANNPGPGYSLQSWQAMDGQIWYQWVIEMKDPYVMLLERIEKLERDFAELKGIVFDE